MATDKADFKRWVAWLRKHFRPCYPVTVKLVEPSKMPVAHSGQCTATEGRRFTIKICAGMDWQVTQDTLFEEWAHMLRFHLWNIDGDEHDAIYGAIYNTIKVAYHG
jgi:hypothetical protein